MGCHTLCSLVARCAGRAVIDGNCETGLLINDGNCAVSTAFIRRGGRLVIGNTLFVRVRLLAVIAGLGVALASCSTESDGVAPVASGPGGGTGGSGGKGTTTTVGAG